MGEVLNGIFEGVRVVGTIGAYYFLYEIMRYIPSACSEQISSQEQLEAAIEKELPNYTRKKEGAEIVPVFGDSRGEGSWITAKNNFQLNAYSHAIVRHELEHVFDGHLDKGNLDERKGIDKVLGYILYYLYHERKADLHVCRIRI